MKEALDEGAELFDWEEREGAAGQRHGSKVRGVGVAVSTYGAGSIGFDGLMTIRPDGKLYVQSGIGNLGTDSVIDLARVAADVLGDAVGEGRGRLGQHRKNLPWTCMSVGSQTTHAMTRANHAAAMDARRKLQEIAAQRSRRRARRLRAGQRARVPAAARPRPDLRAGRAAGHRAGRHVRRPRAAGGHPRDHEDRGRGLAGLGLMGVAKDTYPRDGETYSFVAGFAEVEVDVETGALRSSTTSASATSARSSIRAA